MEFVLLIKTMGGLLETMGLFYTHQMAASTGRRNRAHRLTYWELYPSSAMFVDGSYQICLRAAATYITLLMVAQHGRSKRPDAGMMCFFWMHFTGGVQADLRLLHVPPTVVTHGQVQVFRPVEAKVLLCLSTEFIS
jgi:hypothetical protein